MSHIDELHQPQGRGAADDLELPIAQPQTERRPAMLAAAQSGLGSRVVQHKLARRLARRSETCLHEPAPARTLQRSEIKSGLDRGALEKAGHDTQLAPDKIKQAIDANNKRWTGNYRAELLAFLRGGGGPAGAGDGFTEGDVQRVAQLQAGAGGGADGIIGDASMAVLLHAGLKFSAGVNKDKAHPTGKLRPEEVVIEFYPGELEDLAAWDKSIQQAESDSKKKNAAGEQTAPMRELTSPDGLGKLYVKVHGNLVAKFDARGGPPVKVLDVGGHTADPTQGSYHIGKQQKGFTTPSWTYSQVSWGAHIRARPGGTYEMRNKGEAAWKKAPQDAVADQWDTLPKVDGAERGDGETGDIRWWNKNDFGAMAYRLEGSPGFYLHTTPETEEQAALGQNVELAHSHGCVHLNPTQRDEMIAQGYLQQGVSFVCKKYSAHLLPDPARSAMMGK